MRLLLIALICTVLLAGTNAQPVQKHLVPAGVPPLDADVVKQLVGKTCWGFFDRGVNIETARGAIFIRFSPSAPTGDFWKKFGKDAQAAAHRDGPDGYDYMDKTTSPQITAAGTEITFRARKWNFDWFIRPNGAGAYALRAAGFPIRTAAPSASSTALSA